MSEQPALFEQVSGKPDWLKKLEAEQEAERARDAGMKSALDNSGAWKHTAQAAIEYLAKTGKQFTAEDVREIAGDPPGHYNAMGAAIRAAAQRGSIRKVGFRKATRESLHATELAVWEGIDTQERRETDG